MQVKFIKQEQNFDSHLEINKIYSVIAIRILDYSSIIGKKVEFLCIDKECFGSHSYKEDTLYHFRFHYVSMEHFKILSNTIPMNLAIYFGNGSMFIEPEIFHDLWEDFYDDEPIALTIFRKESLRIIAFDAQKDMRGFFAEELLEYIKEEGYDPENLGAWAKYYMLNLLREMYEQDIHSDITNLLEDLTLYDWNPDLAIPEKELIKKLTKWSEEGTVKHSYQELKRHDLLKNTDLIIKDHDLKNPLT